MNGPVNYNRASTDNGLCSFRLYNCISLGTIFEHFKSNMKKPQLLSPLRSF
jgi:hypothetical protein